MHAPRIPKITIKFLLLPLGAFLLARESRAIMPPSPLLSARIIKATYLTDTIIMSDQKIRDSMPRTLNWVSSTGCLLREKTSFMVYSGLVPISPNTTPNAESESVARETL